MNIKAVLECSVTIQTPVLWKILMFMEQQVEPTGPQRPAPTLKKRAKPVAPVYGRATPSLRLGPPANLADVGGQHGCRSSHAATNAQ